VPVEQEKNEILVTGYISPPHITRHSRAYQHFFVNRRPVRSNTIGAALNEAFRSLTPERRFPIAVLGLEVDPALVDCNVHPNKTEVKFQKEGAVFEAVRSAVKHALLREGMMPEAFTSGYQPTRSFVPYPTQPRGTAVVEAVAAMAPQTTFEDLPMERSRFPFSHLLDGLRVIGQAMNTFIIAETRSGIAIIDQHVAHERVIYERLCGIKGKAAVERQNLLSPETINLDQRATLVVADRLEDIHGVGFELEAFGNGAFLLRSVPAVLSGKDYRRVLQDVIDELAEGLPSRANSSPREAVWITTSCKMAVKAGDPLSHAEMLKLLHDLADTENPYLCPHGRPITITLGTDELLRKFKRI
jgi:DNA mismatch repair protein MutL